MYTTCNLISSNLLPKHSFTKTEKKENVGKNLQSSQFSRYKVSRK